MSNQSLKKFNKLPKEMKSQLSLPEFLGTIEDLERQYSVKLTMLFISLVVKDKTLKEVSDYLITKLFLDEKSAQDIENKFSQLLGTLKIKFPQPASIKANTGSISNFSAEDEEEVKSFKDIASYGNTSVNYQQMADLIIAEFGYDDSDEVFKKRLVSLIVARLRDVRDELETKDALAKSKKIGGMEFSDEQINKLLRIINNKLNSNSLILDRTKLKEQAKLVTKTPLPVKLDLQSLRAKLEEGRGQTKALKIKKISPQAKVENALPDSSQADIKRRPPVVTSSKKLSLKIEEEDGLPVIQMPEDDLMIKPKMVKAKQSKLIPQPIPRPSPTPVSTITPSFQKSRKPKLDDVRFSKSLSSPIEELLNMTLIDFRRISDNPQSIIKKIEEKISLLGQDSYTKRIEGINGWYKNEISRFYRLLGQRSMEEGKNIEQVIGERLEAGKPTLTMEEFEAIMELNKKLRF